MYVHEASSNSDSFRCCEGQDGHITTPPLFPQGLRVNANAYVKTLQTIVIQPPWIDSVVNGRPHIFQQDSAPSHKAPKAQ
ncbi:hypothetical protein ACTXT7_009973, partial [Hymenolepis weldensis]